MPSPTLTVLPSSPCRALISAATSAMTALALRPAPLAGTDLCEARRGDLIGREGLGGRGLMLPRVVA